MSNDAFLGNKKYPRKSRCTLHINVNFLILHHLCLIQSKINAFFNFLNFLQPYNQHYLNVLFYFSKKNDNEEAGSVV